MWRLEDPIYQQAPQLVDQHVQAVPLDEPPDLGPVGVRLDELLDGLALAAPELGVLALEDGVEGGVDEFVVVGGTVACHGYCRGNRQTEDRRRSIDLCVSSGYNGVKWSYRDI